MSEGLTIKRWLEHLEYMHAGQNAAARACGVDPGYWAKLKTGEKKNPSSETLRKLGLKKIEVLVPVDSVKPKEFREF